MITFYLICFTLGLSLTVLSALGVFTHLHFGHVHLHFGHARHCTWACSMCVEGGYKIGVSPVNGFTLAAFLCWFGGCGYLLAKSGDFGIFCGAGARRYRAGGRGDSVLVPGEGAAAA